MNGQRIVCRATAIKQKKSASAAILIESKGVRKSVSVPDTMEFSVAVGDQISCVIGKVAVSIPKKPNIVLFTLSSQNVSQTSLTDSPMQSANKMVIEERIFNVMRILSNE